MKIALLSCCAPCSCAVIEKLAAECKDFVVVFYNPNIVPAEEYFKRMKENENLCRKYHVPFVELDYDNACWQMAVKGLENEPERGKRCSVCFYLRLKKTMEWAKQNGFDAVASVLGVSRYKNLAQVNEAARQASLQTGVPYIEVEGRKGGMQERRQQLINALGLYQQNYCGCKPRNATVFTMSDSNL